MSSTLGAGALGAGVAAGFASCAKSEQGTASVNKNASQIAAPRTLSTALFPASLVKKILRSRDYGFSDVALLGFTGARGLTKRLLPPPIAESLALAKVMRQGYVSLCH